MRCEICNEQLTARDSIKRRIGPICAAKQNRFLGSSTSVAADVRNLETYTDPKVQSQLRAMWRAVAADDEPIALFLLGKAKRLAEMSANA